MKEVQVIKCSLSTALCSLPSIKMCDKGSWVHRPLWFSLSFLRGTFLTLLHLRCLLIYQHFFFLVVRETENRPPNSPLSNRLQSTATTPVQWSLSSDLLVKGQWHNWSSIFTSDWLSSDPYLYLHSAIWILMKENGIISISKCVWYTEEKREKTFVYNLYITKSICEGAGRRKWNLL